MIPPPPPKRTAPPPPPKKRVPFRVFSNVDPMMMEEAIWVFGGYPQVDHDEAVRTLRRKIEALGHHELRPTTLFILGRKELGRFYPYLDNENRLIEHHA